PIDTKYPIEIERLLHGNEVLTERKNVELEDEVFYFIGEEEKVDYLFETEDVCLCGNRKIMSVGTRAENATSKTA
ncbi:18809_t:CDS:2, partial [Gigaspora rosea]